jgi:hypothetical protein
MRLLLIVLAMVLVGCKPDPIEACVEAEKNREILECENVSETLGKGRKCPPDDIKLLTTAFEAKWRKGCMRAAAGKED